MNCARCKKALKLDTGHQAFGVTFGPECIKKVLEVQEFEKNRRNIMFTRLYSTEQKQLRTDYLEFYEETAWNNRVELDSFADSVQIFESLKKDFRLASMDFWQGLIGKDVREGFIAIFKSKLAEAGVEA